VPIGVSVRGVPAAAVRLFSYIVPFAPRLQFSDASCGSAVLSAHVFDHQGRPVGGEPVTLTAVAGQFVSGSTSSTSVTLSTDAAGQVKVKMATTGASPNELAASGHTAHRPAPEETGTIRLDGERRLWATTLAIRMDPKVAVELAQRILDLDLTKGWPR
jgi:hypothetical protein